jgi:hypothetical protein
MSKNTRIVLIFQFCIIKIFMGFNYPCTVVAVDTPTQYFGSPGFKSRTEDRLFLSFSSVPADKRPEVRQLRPRPFPSTHLVEPVDAI